MIRLWLKVARVKANLLGKDVAQAAGISQGEYSSIETGKRNPSVKTAKAIAETLGFNWQRFFEEGGK